MRLHCKKTGNGKPLIILHGLLGMLDNWQTIGKILSTDYEVFLVDARNHGHSPHSDAFNYDVMVEDLLEFINIQFPSFSFSPFIIAHSMSGKTAMKFAQKYPEKVEKLIVVDIAPKYYPVSYDNIFEALLAVDFNTNKSRKEVEEVLENFIAENHIRQFLLKNLYWKETNKLAWRFNLQAIYNNLEKIGESANEKIFSKPTLFLRGGKSNYISEEDGELIRKLFPISAIKTIRGSGHWIHTEQPDLFVKAVKEFLEK